MHSLIQVLASGDEDFVIAFRLNGSNWSVCVWDGPW